jgi:hypothetical protein
MSMRMQIAEIGTYKLTIYKDNQGIWEFWIKQKGHMLVRSKGTKDCTETKLLVQKHLYDIVMSKKEKSHFDPNRLLEWRDQLKEWQDSVSSIVGGAG